MDLLLLITLIEEDSLLNVLGRPSSSCAALSFAETCSSLKSSIYPRLSVRLLCFSGGQRVTLKILDEISANYDLGGKR
jgi:hypothetical protein